MRQTILADGAPTSGSCRWRPIGKRSLRIRCQDQPLNKPLTRPNRKLPKMPSRGFFSDADPNAEIYAKGPKKFDPTKKVSRWEPEFIWQTKWVEALQLQDAAEKAKQQRAQQQRDEEQEGVLNFSRVAEINSSVASTTGSQSTSQLEIPSISDIASAKASGSTNPPSVAETKRWERGSKFSRKAVAVAARNELEIATKQAEAEASRLQYEQIKLEFQLWTFAIAVGGAAVAYLSYNQEVAVSFLTGSIGGLLYLRLLNKSVDAYGAGGGLGSAVGGQRLLIPVILVLIFNRWNTLYAANVGLHLQLIPMLLGFFTYKAGVVGRQSLQLLLDLTKETSSRGYNGSTAEEAQAAQASSSSQAEANKEYTRRIMSG